MKSQFSHLGVRWKHTTEGSSVKVIFAPSRYLKFSNHCSQVQTNVWRMTMAATVIPNGEEQEQLLQNGQISRHRRSHTLEPQPECKPECSPQHKVTNENGVVRLLSIAEVPPYLAFNQNIRGGYRNALTLKQCISRLVFKEAFFPFFFFVAFYKNFQVENHKFEDQL